jgi:hypothetical protein
MCPVLPVSLDCLFLLILRYSLTFIWIKMIFWIVQLSIKLKNVWFHLGRLTVIQMMLLSVKCTRHSKIGPSPFSVWLPLCLFPNKMMFGSFLPALVCRRALVLFTFVCVCLHIMVYLFCFSLSYVPCVASFSGLSFSIDPSVSLILKSLLVGKEK